MEIDPATTADVDEVADCWVALAADQRAHGSHLLAAANREAVRETVARRAVVDVLFVARHPSGDGGSEVEASGDGRGDEGSDDEGSGDEGSGDEGSEGETTDRDDARVRGFVTAAMETGAYEQDVTRGVVDNLYVDPEFRDRGVGADLLGAAERALADAGADVVALEAMAANADARRFYERRGYEPHRVELEKDLRDSDGNADPAGNR